MIAHALTIVRNELEAHLTRIAPPAGAAHSDLGNIAELGVGPGGSAKGRDRVLLSVVNLQEERTLRNAPTYVRDDVSLRVRYENPPTFLNLAVLVAATHTDYPAALLALSRAIAFFQYRSVFTHDSVDPLSRTNGAPNNPLDQLETFKLIFTLGSPSLEEVNDMWGMLGGKQFPFALYGMRMLELKFRAVSRESGVITEIVRDYTRKVPVS
jgi:hypothetical protein